MTTDQVIDFVPLLGFEDKYEILNQYPYTVRRKDNKYIVKESVYNKGYVLLKLNSKTFIKHRIIAKQFLPNPDNLACVDHINHDRADNRLENLRWTSHIENNTNRSISTKNSNIIYKFVDKLPSASTVINKYNKHQLRPNHYYYYHNEETNEDEFYLKITDESYKRLYINEMECGTKYVLMYDTNNKRVNVCITKFKLLYDL